MRTAILFVAAGALALPSPSPSVAWTSLFNGKDLAGWDTWLGIPHASVSGLDLP